MYAIKQLRRRKNLSQSNLAQEIGVSLRTIQLYEKRNANIPIKKLTKIATFFELSIAELYQHESNEPENTYDRKKSFTKNGCTFYPIDYGKYLIMVPLVLSGQENSYIQSLSEKKYGKSTIKSGFVLEAFEDRVYRAFEVTGNSMDDGSIGAIPNKAIVLGLQLDTTALAKASESLWNKPYILVCKDRIICKRLTGFNGQNNTVKCQNLNTSPEHQDFELPLEDMLLVFQIVRKQL